MEQRLAALEKSVGKINDEIDGLKKENSTIKADLAVILVDSKYTKEAVEKIVTKLERMEEARFREWYEKPLDATTKAKTRRFEKAESVVIGAVVLYVLLRLFPMLV